VWAAVARDPFRFRTAFVRGLSPAFAAAAVRHAPAGDAVAGAAAAAAGPSIIIDQARAAEEHAAYVEALRCTGVAVVEVPGDPALPDCCFIEDAAVAVGDRALITRPGHPSRRGETAAVAAALAAHGVTLAHTPDHATIDGGDVMFTGSALFVGVGGRTNAAGAEALAAAFPLLRVEAVALPIGGHGGVAVGGRTRGHRRERSAQRFALLAAAGLPARRAPAAAPSSDPFVLHLKSCMSPVAPGLVALADTPAARAIAAAIASTRGGRGLQWMLTPSPLAANVVRVNGYLLRPPAAVIGQEGDAVWQAEAVEGGGELAGVTQLHVGMAESAKADGALTCCSLLVHV
jgi:N-dimethylarginine dimethylaminohydrolase